MVKISIEHCRHSFLLKNSLRGFFVLIFTYIFLSKDLISKEKVLAAKSSPSSEQNMLQRKLVDKTVATVGGQALLYSEVMGKVNNKPLILFSSYPAKPSAPKFQQALQDLINQNLILQDAEKKELKIDDSAVAKHIKRLMKENSLDVQKLEILLAQEGKNLAEYKKDIKLQMLYHQWQGRELYSKVRITKADLEAYYLEKTGSNSDAIQVSLRRIFIELPKNSNDLFRQKIKDHVDDIYSQLQKGQSFLELEKLHSILPDAREGKTALKVRMQDLTESVQSILSQLKAGEFSKPSLTDNGWDIYYLEKKSFSVSRQFLEKKAALEIELRNKELQRLLILWLNQARQSSKVEVFSDLQARK